MGIPPFPFAAPSIDETAPQMSGVALDEYGRDADVLAWFLLHRGGAAAARLLSSSTSQEAQHKSPVLRWIELLRNCAAGVELPGVRGHELLTGGAYGSSATLAAVVDFYAARLCAWAVRRLESEHASANIEFHVHGGFVTEELAKRDSTNLAEPAIASGLGTLLVGAQLASERRGRIEIMGSGSPGLDIEWTVEAGLSIRVEHKAQAFSSAYRNASPSHDVLRNMWPQIVEKSGDLRRRTKADGVPALCVIAFTGLYPWRLAEHLEKRDLRPDLAGAFAKAMPGKPDPYLMPHAALFNLYGIDGHVDGHGTYARRMGRAFPFPDARPRASKVLADLFETVFKRTAK